MKPEDVVIPEDALSERFLAATGPGGQNVNKVATACQLRADVFKLGLAPHAEMIAQAHVVQAKRRPTKPSRAAKARRVDQKKGRSAVKAGRGKVSWD